MFQNCGIGDASRGSLSSYTYVIMMIYYLQQCNPPVLPVLQQVYRLLICTLPVGMVSG